MPEKTPSPTPGTTPPSQRANDIRQEAHATLKKANWITDGSEGVQEVLGKLLELALTNLNNKTTGPTTRAKNEPWEKVKAAAWYLKEFMESRRTDEIVEKVRRAVETDWENNKPDHVLDETALAERVTKAVVEKFETKMDELAGQAASLKISDESSFAQIIADRVQSHFEEVKVKLVKEAETTFEMADRITARVHTSLDEATDVFNKSTETMKKLEERLTDLKGSEGELFNHWMKAAGRLETAVNDHDKPNLSFAEVVRKGAEARAEQVAGVATTNLLRAQHVGAIRETEANARKVVIRPTPTTRDSSRMLKTTEEELVQGANAALEEIGVEGAKTGTATLKFVSARRIPGGALLYAANEETVELLKMTDNLRFWSASWEYEISASVEQYEAVVEMVPIDMDINNADTLRHIEEISSLPPDSIQRARWIKAVERRGPQQRFAFAIFSFDSPHAANHAIRNGLIVQGKSLEVRKSLPEPRRCLKCQRPGHFARECRLDNDVCARCAGHHRTSKCEAGNNEVACAVCNVKGHSAADRSCPSFTNRVSALHERRLGCKYRFFVTADDPESWVQIKEKQVEQFDESWRGELRQRDHGWQQVERRGNGRLAGGPRGGGAGTRKTPPTGPRLQNTQPPTIPGTFGSQRTMDSWLHRSQSRIDMGETSTSYQRRPMSAPPSPERNPIPNQLL